MSRPGGSSFRPDVEGLRAVAVLLVLLYHAGVTWLPGGFAGVDVFFVISGFLITGLLVREAADTGRIRLGRFWARRARRLLPASALVLVTTAVLTALTLPQVRWRETGGDLIASAVYLVNWRLADRSVDYLAEDSAPSPVQHFWSLAVEEQFYLLWPLLILFGLLLVRRGATPPGARRLRPVLAVLLVVVVALPSFAWSVHLTGAAPAEAYFVTTTRLWQLGAGALLAIGIARVRRLPTAVAVPLGWAGLIAIVAGAVLQDGSAWPGSAALLPTLGAVAVLAAGVTAPAGGAGVATLLARRPMQTIGGLSYSLYLWHWPLLVCAAGLWGELSVAQGLGVTLVSVLPAWLGYRYVENPLRRHRRLADRTPGAGRRTVALALACTVLAAGGGGALVGSIEHQLRQAREAGTAVSGAGALGAGGDPEDAATTTAPGRSAPSTSAPTTAAPTTSVPTTAAPTGPTTAQRLDGRAGFPSPDPADVDIDPAPDRIVPDPLAATEDLPRLYADGCDAEVAGEMVRCDYGDPDGDLDVALIGDSKSAQWGDALDAIGREHGWSVRVYYRSACSVADAAMPYGGARARDCHEFGQQVLAELTSDAPDVVLTSMVYGTARPWHSSERAGRQYLVDGLVSAWEDLTDAGVPVVAVADNPQPEGVVVYECVAEHRDEVEACSFPSGPGLGTRGLTAAVERVPESALVDMNDWICPDGQTCPAVIGEVLTYRQGSHLTNTYAVSLREVLHARLEHAFTLLGVTDA